MRTGMTLWAAGFVSLFTCSAAGAGGAKNDRLQLMDVFQLEYASDPQISPDGKKVVYVRNYMDVMKDRRRANLWMVDVDTRDHRPLTTGKHNDGSPRWSPDSQRLLYLSDADGSPQLYCRWMDSGQIARLTNVTSAPSSPTWSPDGKRIAFSMHVEAKARPFVDLPAKPKGAEWADPPKVIRNVVYRRDGEGYRKEGHSQLFLLPAEGGTPRQLTNGPFDHRGPLAWTPDGRSLIFSANRHAEGELDPLNTEIYELAIRDGSLKSLTNRKGPDGSPAVSSDGRSIAYVGFDDQRQAYKAPRLYVMNRDGTQSRTLAEKLDRPVKNPVWSKDGSGIYFLFEDRGSTHIGFAPLQGKVGSVVSGVGGVVLGRPYAAGSFSVADDGSVAFTLSTPKHPADVAVHGKGPSKVQRLTKLNDDLFGHKDLGDVEEIWYTSAHDGRKVQGWIVKPPHFDARKKYPLILEIHGGPYADYGARFAFELQLMAAAGYVVFYANPRGSTGYGEEFAQLINHNYPSHDYDDLMSGVDAVIQRGFIDIQNLFVTGGSGGGVLTSWIVGKTGRFRAAVAAYPVINWYSWALTVDGYPFYTQYWFSAPPWQRPEEYLKRSPISLVGNVTTPTMVLTGEVDFRTPIAESEQFYQALKLRKVNTALVRFPGASHDVSARPSHLIAKVACILKWFETHRRPR